MKRRIESRPGGSSRCVAPCLVSLLMALLFACSETESAPRPDVIFLSLDTTRADHVGSYGYVRDTTPELDAFAAEAVRYARAWSTASWTLPSHASMFTGKHPTSHGAHFNAAAGKASLADVFDVEEMALVRVNVLGDHEVTLAELLRDAGYETAAFVGGAFLSPRFGILQGYTVQDYENTNIGGRPADVLTDRAAAFLRSVPRERPVHLLVNYFDPHAPYVMKKGFAAPGPRRIAGDSVEERRQARRLNRYDSEIRFMDYHIGRLFDVLRELGRYDRALIVAVADHGETFGEHGLIEHGRWLYDDVLRVPLIIRLPGGERGGTVVEQPVSVVDLLPLIARVAGLELPAGIDAVDLESRDLVVAESYRDYFYMKHHGASFDRDLTSAVRWPWKLILSDKGVAELYRLDEDPGELRNLADGKREKALREELEKARASFVRPENVSLPEDLPAEARERLRALGYIE